MEVTETPYSVEQVKFMLRSLFLCIENVIAVTTHLSLHRSSRRPFADWARWIKNILQGCGWKSLLYTYKSESTCTGIIWRMSLQQLTTNLFLHRSSRGPFAHRARWLFLLHFILQRRGWDSLQWSCFYVQTDRMSLCVGYQWFYRNHFCPDLYYHFHGLVKHTPIFEFWFRYASTVSYITEWQVSTHNSLKKYKTEPCTLIHSYLTKP